MGPPRHAFLLPVLGAGCLAACSACGQARDPFTRLFDTGSPAAKMLSAADLAGDAAWRQIPEHNTSHVFSGDAVFRNNTLVVVLRKQGWGPEVYTMTADGPRHRALLVGVPERGSPLRALDAIGIAENASGAVRITATSGKTKPITLSFRLTAGESILEMRSTGTNCFLKLVTQTRYLVVPDYFGDDMVFDATTSGSLPLPAENTCLSLLDGGEAMLMSIWQSANVQAWLGIPDVNGKTWAMTMDCTEGSSIWLAFLEYPGIWRARNGAARDLWNPPFPAMWRCSLVKHDGTANTWDLNEGPQRKQSAGTGLGPLIVYPIDRGRKTPLTVSCPTDVMRNTLGVGPCQYILGVEGLSSSGSLTPDSVMDWVEKQFRRKRQRKVADEIRERLDRMVAHVTHVRKRIETYGGFAGDVRTSLGSRPGWDRFASIVDDMHRFAEAGLAAEASPRRARQLADDIAAMVRQPEPLAEGQRVGGEIRVIGALQDGALARCRMAVRRLKQQALIVAEDKLEDAEVAREAQRLAEGMLAR